MPENLVKILVAVLLGGLIGAERQFRDKAAGFRTVILICVGSTLFTILSQRIGGLLDPARIAANVVVGVGFLGAGVILRQRGQIVGITTASTVWVAAALGLGIGSGAFVLCAFTTLAVLAVLLCFPRLERLIGRSAEIVSYEVVADLDISLQKHLTDTIAACGLRILTSGQAKSEDRLTCTWRALGTHQQHQQLWSQLLADPAVKEFRAL